MPTKMTRRQAIALPAGLAVGSLIGRSAFAAEPIKIGLVAALSGPSAKSGEGITRGLQIAIDEINGKGGLLGGRMLELVRRDDESNPAKGQTAARELIDKEGAAILYGGIDSPVSLAIVPLVNSAKVPFMGVWAAATNITRNGANPNYVFRVSAVDVLVDRALIKYAMAKFGSKKPGLMLVNNGWGESNLAGLTAAAQAAGITLAGAEKFDDKDPDMTPQLQRLREAGADTVILVGNAAPGAQVIKSLQKSAWVVPIVSHWGISGGRFPELAGSWAGKVHFVQTYSFFGPQNDVGKRVLAAMMAKYPDVKGPGDITPPVGVANAYDAMQLTALAITKAGTTEGPKLREGLLSIDSYQGLIKNYVKPFTDENHDALNENDYVMVRYNGDQIEPVTG
ncbi:MAG TPA: ABC transporter substrate-binding protein [Bradyrhizobium sp.]|uniref:ABC transporter substrate-binding protein n=1 Tax=Bradyrhizobium sp. TaxID=376 RepID=UPI002D7EA827|nr:ABC transporter substrate-binding protein [Bradyrhizobium sp.]HET7886693.1 ABC transporter substrate-binding protein [Bradyrhizobium sp.]